MAELCAALMVAGLTAYVVLAGADFGGGVWDLIAGGSARGGPVRGLIQRSMSPVWEANHVWLIFVLTVFWTAFPTAFGSVASTLYVPLAAAAVGIIFRGTAFALRGEAGTMRQARGLGGLFAASSVLVPFAMGTAVGAVASGRVPVGNAVGDPVTTWLNPTGLFVGVLSVSLCAYLAAVFLCHDAVRAEQPELVRAFRRRAYAAGVVTGVLALVGLVVLHADARHLFDGLTSGWGVVLVAASAVAGGMTLVLVRGSDRLGLARVSGAAAVVFMMGAWVVAQQPDLLPGRLTITQAAAGDATLAATLVTAGIAIVVLGPSLWLLFHLVLQGKLDPEYEPLDRRFRPADVSAAGTGADVRPDRGTDGGEGPTR